MMRNLSRHGLALGFLSLLCAGCNRPEPDPAICAAVASESVAAGKLQAALKVAHDPSAVFAARAANADSCLQRWAYRLAPGGESAESVSTAVLGGCQTSLSDAATSAAAVPSRAGPVEPAAAAERIQRQASERARFFVIAARAGRCREPSS